MILLDRPLGHADDHASHIIALFGMGLIGASIVAWIEGASPAQRRTLPFSWGPSAVRGGEMETIMNAIARCGSGNYGDGRIARLDVIWCAGKGGFASKDEELAHELEAFEDVLALSGRLYGWVPGGAKKVFHLFSSAGGLFEGQRYVDSASRPAPLRPYGQYKLYQEQYLTSLPASVHRLVYRPTSVYGYTSDGRAGLIVALIQNAITNHTTRIFGDPDTVRDYVLVDDIGRFVGNQVLGGDGRSRTLILASGKPTSMAEVINLVQSVLRRQLYIQFDPARSNARHNSVRPSGLPGGWHPTHMQIGVTRTARLIDNAFLAPSVRPVAR